MGKIILCVGQYAKNPFCFTLTRVNVYSIEELCYYIYQNIYIITEDLFDKKLFDWIEKELVLVDIAEKLSELKKKKFHLKDLVITLLNSTNYYTEEEITILIGVIEKIENLTPLGKQEIKADNYLKYNSYKKAAKLYKNILEHPDAVALTSDEYGNILHNLAIAHVYTNSYQEAAIKLKEAYQRNGRKESLTQYLYVLYLGGYKELFYTEANEYELSDNEVQGVIQNIKDKVEQAKESSFYQQIKSLITMKESGRMEEYYDHVDEFIAQWKKEYRDMFREESNGKV